MALDYFNPPVEQLRIAPQFVHQKTDDPFLLGWDHEHEAAQE